MKKAVAYARFSSNNQREESIDAQLRAIEEYAQRNNILLIDKYIDKLYEHLTTTISSQEKEFLVLKEQLEKLDTEEEVLNNTILNGVMNQGIVDKNNSIQERKKAIGKQLMNFKTDSYSKDEIREFMYQFNDFRNLTDEDKKNLLNIFVYQVELFDDTMNIKINTQPFNRKVGYKDGRGERI